MAPSTGLIALALVGSVASVLACGRTSCCDYSDAVDEKLHECGIPHQEFDCATLDCTEATALEICLTSCIEDVTCGTLDGTDLLGLEQYSNCVEACSEDQR